LSSIKYKLFFIVTITIVTYNYCIGQSTFYRKYSIQQGLLSSDNYRVTQDLEGFIWICSEAGVTKFDGNNFKKFTIKEGLPFNDVWEIHIDSKNRKWLNSFSNGMEFIENDSIKTIDKSLAIDQIYYAGEHDDTVFFYSGNEEGVKRYYYAPNGDFAQYNRFSHLGYDVWGDFREQGKFILIPKKRTEDFKLKVYDIKTRKIEDLEHNILYAQERNMREIDVFMYNNKEGYLFLTWKKGELKPLNVDPNISNHLKQVIYDPTSKYSFLKTADWIYVYSNLKELKRDFEIEEILNKRFPFPEKIEYIHIDIENNIWITELRGEVYFIPQMGRWALNSIMDSNFPLDANVSSILDYQNQILFLSRSFKIYSYNKQTKKISFIRDNYKIFRHWKIRDNKLYILFLGELCIYPIVPNKESFIIDWSKEKIIKVNGALTFDFINNSTIMLGSGKLVDLNRFEEIDFHLKFPQRTNNVFEIDSSIIYTFINGIKTYNLKSRKIYETNIRNAEFVKKLGDFIVIGTKGEGVHFLKIKSGKLIKLKQQFKEIDVNDAFLYKGIWHFATNKGIISAKLNGNLSLTILDVHLSQRLLGLHINRIVVDDYFIYAFTTKGMYTIDKTAYAKRKINSIAFVAKMKVGGVEYSNQNVIKLSSFQNYINFSLSPISYYNLGEVKFRYKLLGWEKWEYTSELIANLENLEPGNYTFVVESAENEFENFSNRMLFKFEIDKPIYQKWWFRIIAALFLILIIGSTNLMVRRITARKLKRKNQMKNIELKALRAQLNPHFVFNSLNTIQSMIILRSEREANEYIVSFAELMRKVLDNSNYERVSLKNEIEFLENYLMLENIRINYTLDYEISFEKDLNLSEIMIYSMVYQPIVENVLVHAFLTNQSDKQLDINFSLENEMLTATITDNGIGREKSAELNKNKVHKSWASTILNEKANLLNEMKKKELSIEIIDLYDDGVATGTKVIVNMRIIRKKEI